jgi:hypothetical protein
MTKRRSPAFVAATLLQRLQFAEEASKDVLTMTGSPMAVPTTQSHKKHPKGANDLYITFDMSIAELVLLQAT